MAYVSLVEMMSESLDNFRKSDTKLNPLLGQTLFFFIGIGLCSLLDYVMSFIGDDSNHFEMSDCLDNINEANLLEDKIRKENNTNSSSMTLEKNRISEVVIDNVDALKQKLTNKKSKNNFYKMNNNSHSSQNDSFEKTETQLNIDIIDTKFDENIQKDENFNIIENQKLNRMNNAKARENMSFSHSRSNSSDTIPQQALNSCFGDERYNPDNDTEKSIVQNDEIEVINEPNNNYHHSNILSKRSSKKFNNADVVDVIVDSVKVAHVYDDHNNINKSLIEESEGTEINSVNIKKGNLLSKERMNYEDENKEEDNQNDQKRESTTLLQKSDKRSLKRLGVLTAIAITLHNIPEGVATFTSTLSDVNIGIMLTVAIAIHNIPEGLSVAFPIYYSTGSKLKSLLWGFFSGLSEPFAALIEFIILKIFNIKNTDFTPFIYGIIYGIVAGVMTYISLCELIPTARKYDTKSNGNITTIGFISGMAVMSLSLVLLDVFSS